MYKKSEVVRCRNYSTYVWARLSEWHTAAPVQKNAFSDFLRLNIEYHIIMLGRNENKIPVIVCGLKPLSAKQRKWLLHTRSFIHSLYKLIATTYQVDTYTFFGSSLIFSFFLSLKNPFILKV